MQRFDVIVVGAGTSGCLTAKTVTEAGLSVCLIDQKRGEDVGKKTCGDAVGKHHFDLLGLEWPSGKELERKIMGIKIFSPDTKTVICTKGKALQGYILNRHRFGQRLLEDSINEGSTFLDSTKALEPIIKDKFVVGVLVKNLKTGVESRLSGRVVVEASGYLAVLRNKLPPEIGVDSNVEKKDVEIVYREIRELKEQVADPDFCEIYISRRVAPGGYYWIFPESGLKVNVGLGVAMSKGFPNPKDQLYNNVLSRQTFQGSTILEKGAWYDPARRPINCMTGNGVLVVGDAACQVNPIHGGGIGPSMMGGALAGKTIIEALEKGDVGREGLWLYNTRYMRSYGSKQAGLDVFRLLLQKLSDDDLNYGMKHRLITEEDILRTSMGEDVRLNITETTLRVFRGLRKLSFLNKLRSMADQLKKAKVLYRNYPDSPRGFEEWKKKSDSLFERAS